MDAATIVQQLEELKLMLEISNERWVTQVNENMRLEVELRSLKQRIAREQCSDELNT